MGNRNSDIDPGLGKQEKRSFDEIVSMGLRVFSFMKTPRGQLMAPEV